MNVVSGPGRRSKQTRGVSRQRRRLYLERGLVAMVATLLLAPAAATTSQAVAPYFCPDGSVVYPPTACPSTASAPGFTTAASADLTIGTQGSFSIAATGNPIPGISMDGELPTGLTFNGVSPGGSVNVATVSGTPARGTEGTYSLTFTAQNSVGTATQAFTLTVRPGNAAPTVTSAAENPIGAEGSALQVQGTFGDTDGDALAITQTQGLGQIAVTGNTWTWTHTPTDDATGDVVVQADDGKGGVVTDTFTWRADNVAPSVTFSAITPSADCSGSTTVEGSFTDPGADQWMATIDWGDGSAVETLALTATNSFSASHPYAAPGRYTATITVTDDEGDSGTASGPVETMARGSVTVLAPLHKSDEAESLVNTMKNGRVVPVKVQLFDACTGLAITDPSTDVTIRLTKVSAPTTLVADPVDSYADAGASSGNTAQFRWSDEGFWRYNLDTEALGLTAGSTYRIDVLLDGTTATTHTWILLKPTR